LEFHPAPKEKTLTEQWLSPKDIAAQYHVSYRTAVRWIMRILGDDVRMTDETKGRGKRPYRLRRIRQSLLEKNLDQFLNG
jgi:hypothetical protein